MTGNERQQPDPVTNVYRYDILCDTHDPEAHVRVQRSVEAGLSSGPGSCIRRGGQSSPCDSVAAGGPPGAGPGRGAALSSVQRRPWACALPGVALTAAPPGPVFSAGVRLLGSGCLSPTLAASCGMDQAGWPPLGCCPHSDLSELLGNLTTTCRPTERSIFSH